MPAAVPTEADLDLIAGAADQGARVTVRQLQEWRRAGLVFTPHVAHLGRGRGTRSSYPEGALDRLVTVAGMLASDRNLDRTALRLFAAGEAVHEERLRASYERVLAPIEGQARRLLATLNTETSDDPEAIKAVSKAARKATVAAWRRRLGAPGQRIDVLRSVLTNLAMILVEGEPASTDGFDELRTALGASNLPLAENLDAAPAAIGELRAVARSASIGELRWAVESLRIVVRFWSTFRLVMDRTGSWSPELDRLDGLHSGWSDNLAPDDDLVVALVGLVFLSANGGKRHDQVTKDVDTFRRELPRYLALAHLTDNLEPDEWRYLGLGGSIALTQVAPGERERYFAKVRAWCDEHPDEAEAIAPT